MRFAPRRWNLWSCIFILWKLIRILLFITYDSKYCAFSQKYNSIKNEKCLLDRAVNIKEQNRCLTMIGKFCVEETQFILGTNCIHCIQNLLFIECKCTPGFWHVHVGAKNALLFHLHGSIRFTVTFVFSFCCKYEKVSRSSLLEVVQFHLLETVFGKVSSLLQVIGQWFYF